MIYLLIELTSDRLINFWVSFRTSSCVLISFIAYSKCVDNVFIASVISTIAASSLIISVDLSYYLQSITAITRAAERIQNPLGKRER